MTATQAPTPGPLDWTAHDGSDVPIFNTYVDVVKRDGSEWANVHSGQWGQDWLWSDDDTTKADIVSWRPSRLAPTAPVEASGSEECSDLYRLDDPFNGSVTRLASWPEGLVLWHDGEIVWRSWGPKALRPQPSGETRNMVARIIRDERGENPSPLAKADAILALLALGGQQGGEATVPASEYHRRGVSIINLTEHAGAHLCRAEKAEAKIARLSGGQGVEAEAEDAWSRLLDADDRTSPPEYPEHCLITKGELAGFMGDAAFIARTTPARAEAQDEGAAGEIKPCPFCGAGAQACKNDHDDPVWSVECDECPASLTSDRFNRDTAIAAWNARAHPSPTPAADADRVRIAVEAITKAKDLDVSLLHDGYDSGAGGGNYVYADVVRTEELFPLLDQALAALKSEGK